MDFLRGPRGCVEGDHGHSDTEDLFKCTLVEKFPAGVDVFCPSDWTSVGNRASTNEERRPKPPHWIIVRTKDERSNIIKVGRYLEQKVGSISRHNLKKFGNNSLLVKAKSDIQAVMLLNLDLGRNSILQEVKPHLQFSYSKGVVFNKDIYDFDETEILEMSPECVWKVSKVPNSSMIILTFKDSVLPESHF
ncbi:MAG: hypothetical protein AAFU33_26785 [Bacteroidota bacterium]